MHTRLQSPLSTIQAPVRSAYVSATPANVAAAGAMTAGVAIAPKPDREATVIGALNIGALLMPIMFMGSMVSKPIAWVLGGAVGLVHKNSGLAIKGAINGFYTALHQTTLDKAASFGVNYAQARSDITGKAVSNFDQRLAAADVTSGKVNNAIARTLAPVGNVLGKAVDRFDETSVAQKLSGWLKGFAGKRETKLLLKAAGDEASLAKASGWGKLAKSGSVGSLLKALPKNLGKGNLFAAIAVAGATMATSAMVLGNRRATREDNVALREFSAAVYGVEESAITKEMLAGKNAHPIVQEAHKIYDKNVTARRIMNTFGIAGDTLMVGNMTSAASGALMAAEMVLPQLGSMLAHENPTLAIFHALKQADAGHMELSTEQRTQAIAQLISTVPAVAKHGGTSNAYVTPVAEAIAKKGLSALEVVHTIANPEKFDALSKQVIAEIKQEQAKAEVAAKASEKVANAKPEALASAAASSHLAAAPAAKVSAIAHQGQVDTSAVRTK